MKWEHSKCYVVVFKVWEVERMCWKKESKQGIRPVRRFVGKRMLVWAAH